MNTFSKTKKKAIIWNNFFLSFIFDKFNEQKNIYMKWKMCQKAKIGGKSIEWVKYM